jgi:glycosyltransferase involved in cell wall biosynthesis
MPKTGVSASEAMAHGTYPIVTDIPGNRWIKHRENATVLIEDYKKLADEILWAFNNTVYREKSD